MAEQISLCAFRHCCHTGQLPFSFHSRVTSSRMRRRCTGTALRGGGARVCVLEKAAPHEMCTTVWVVLSQLQSFARQIIRIPNVMDTGRQAWHSFQQVWDVENASYVDTDHKIIWADRGVGQPWVGDNPGVVWKGGNRATNWTDLSAVWAHY